MREEYGVHGAWALRFSLKSHSSSPEDVLAPPKQTRGRPPENSRKSLFEEEARAAGRSEEDEDLLHVALDVLDLLSDDVEADGLGDGSALADGDDITGLDSEGGRAVGGHGLMALLESVVLLDVVQVVTADDHGAGHFGRDHDAPINSSSQQSALDNY